MKKTQVISLGSFLGMMAIATVTALVSAALGFASTDATDHIAAYVLLFVGVTLLVAAISAAALMGRKHAAEVDDFPDYPPF